jgi:excinuclease ABC subunit A
MPKAKVEHIEGLSAAIAIEQKNHAGNPRSTIGTMTEVYDFLRVLFAHLGTAYSPETGEEIRSISQEFVLNKLLDLTPKTKVQILSPLTLRKQDLFEELKKRLQEQGFLRIRLNKEYFELDQEIPYDRQRKNELFLVIDRLVITESVRSRLLEAIDQASTLSGGTLVAATEKEDLFFNLSFACVSTGKSYSPITPHSFSFNTDSGMCLDCLGLGIQYGADLARQKELMQLSSFELILLLWKEQATRQALEAYYRVLKEAGIDPDMALKKLSPDQLQLLLNGEKEEESKSKKGLRLRWLGIHKVFAKAAKSAIPLIRTQIIPLMDQSPCISCEGTRLNPLARHVRIGPLSLPALCRLPIDEASSFIAALKLEKTDHHFLEETLFQVNHRLDFLKAIGLSYLSLDRSAPTLSGGETQRIRLARQLGSGLTGCLYVLDEPTIGLHPHNNALLNSALKKLCAMDNTLILVEHDPMTIELADLILDFGKGAGKLGGEIVARGTLAEIKADPNSLTGAYLSGRKKIAVPTKRRTSSSKIEIKNASLHNLKNLNVEFPIGAISCVTGVSGSGKSTLVNDLLRPAVEQALRLRKKSVEYAGSTVNTLSAFDKLLVLDQNPIGHTIRADVSTYIDLLTSLRYFYASLPHAQMRGLAPKNFSFNHRKGMCTTCFGLGTRSIQLQFLPPVKVTCEACHGFRLNPLSLEVDYKGKNLGAFLQMTALEAKEWLIPIPKANRLLDTLIAVGLGYLKLGQEIATLSGGEAQRIRLSRELAKRSTGRTLYLLDEPTIGLHSDDIAKLLNIFHTLADQGNTLIIIEHNLDVMANADFLLDLGPDAGMQGGQLITQGTPEEVAKHPHSYTAKYLAPYLKNLSKK